MIRRIQAAALAGVVAAACAACALGSDPSAQDDPAGGRQQTITLTAWSGEAQSRPSGAQLASFADAVSRLSDGRIVVTTEYGAGSGPTADGNVIEAVRADHVDIGLEASRSFSGEGVLTFRAITAPFLIQTNELAAAVSGDPTVTTPMLAGLTASGMTGLGLLPETIRHPFGAKSQPVLGPADYRGKVVRSLTSTETYAVFRALGAEPGFWDLEDFQTRLDTGKIDIVESSFELAKSVMGRAAVATGNVAFFPRMNVLFANSGVVSRLSSGDRDILVKAADAARQQAISAITPEEVAAKAYCLEGGQVVNASSQQRQELATAVGPYMAGLEADPATRTVVEAIKALAARTPGPASPPMPCGTTPAPPSRDPPWPVSASASPIDGTYRVTVTDDDLQKVGVPPAEIAATRGTITMTIRRGQMTVDQVADPPVAEPHTVWSIAFRPARQVMLIDPTADPAYIGVIWTGTWEQDADGNLRLHDYVSGHDGTTSDYVWWFSKPLVRIS